MTLTLTHKLHKDAFRPAREPMPEIPVGARSAGYYKLAPPFESPRKTVTFTQFFWLTLDGPLAAAAVAAFGLEADVRDAGAPPAALFHQLMQTIAKPARQNELRTGELAETKAQRP